MYTHIYRYIYPLIAPQLFCESTTSPARWLAFTRYSFTSRLLCTNHSLFYCPSHLHCPHSCNTFAILLCNIRPPSDPPFLCRTPHIIVHGNIV